MKPKREWEKIMNEIVEQKFPRGERQWCVECARRIRKAVKAKLNQTKE